MRLDSIVPAHERLPDEGYDDDEGGPKSARNVIVVGGGRGGVGKSLVASNLAVYLAQLGKDVVLVDADAAGGNVHAGFGLKAAWEEPSLDTGDATPFVQALEPTLVPGLRVLPAAHDALEGPQSLRGGRKTRWMARLRQIPCDFVVIDAGPGAGALPVDLLGSADWPIVVSTPDPASVESTWRLLRVLYKRRLRRALVRDKFRWGLLERALRELGRVPSPLALVRALEKKEQTLAELAWAEAQRTRLLHVVNATRVRADAELGAWMSMLARRHYGLGLDELGFVEIDDTVWIASRRRKPLLVDSPASKAARNLERVARRVVALVTSARTAAVEVPSPIPDPTPDLYTVLGANRSSSDDEIRRAYRKHKEIYGADSIATATMLDDGELVAARARLDEAYDTLLDPIRRRAYDLSVFAEEEEREQRARALPRPALAAEQLLLQSELEREIGPDTEFDGALLRRVRESQGVELGEISSRTKISRVHLAALEEEDFERLPAAVYVRGFVAELAKYLRLDPQQVQRTYLRRLRERAAP